MPVNTRHPDYNKQAPVWKACRDVAGGQRTVHAAGTAYLPMLSGESEADYKARLARAMFFNATWRTIAGLGGMLLRKRPTFKVSKLAEAMLEDVTQSGRSHEAIAAEVVEECLTVGRVGLMVDYPRATIGEGATVAEVEALNLRPKLAVYKAEAVINWASTWLNNRSVLSRVVLEERASVDGADEFETKTELRWRVLDLAPYVAPVNRPETAAAGGSMRYRVRVFRENKEAKTPAERFQIVEGPFYPLMGGQPLPYLPFVFIGVDNTTPDVEEPPLVDLVYVNLSHYQSTADVEHGAHKTALPQPWATGLQLHGNGLGNPDDPSAGRKPTLYMGGSELWTNPSADGAFGMLEYTGQGLEAIEKRLERKEKHMAVLGARMLEDQKREAETSEVAAMHRSGEHATLATQGKTAAAGIRQALEWFDLWAGGAGGVEYALNDQFLPAKLTPEQLRELVGAWQGGAITSEDLFDNLQAGGIVREEKSYAEHETGLENEPARLSAGAAGTGATPPVDE